MQRKSLLFTHKTGGFAATSGFMVFVYFCIDRNDKSILIRALHAQYRERKAKGKSYTEIGQLILRIDATAPGRLCLGDDEYLLARNALNDLRNQRIASGGYTDAADAALANLLRAKVPFHLFGHMR